MVVDGGEGRGGTTAAGPARRVGVVLLAETYLLFAECIQATSNCHILKPTYIIKGRAMVFWKCRAAAVSLPSPPLPTNQPATTTTTEPSDA